jgi:NADH dehydrogenase
VVIVGAGFTGIEVAAEMPAKLEKQASPATGVSSSLTPTPLSARRSEKARARSSAKRWRRWAWKRGSTQPSRLSRPSSVTLGSGEIIPARTVVWCAGMRASAVAQTMPAERDRLGRLNVDQFMRVAGMTDIFCRRRCGLLRRGRRAFRRDVVPVRKADGPLCREQRRG